MAQDRWNEVIHTGQEGIALLGEDIESTEGAMLNGQIARGYGGLGDMRKRVEIVSDTAQFIQHVAYIEELRPTYTLLVSTIAFSPIITTMRLSGGVASLRKKQRCFNDLSGQAGAINGEQKIWHHKGNLSKSLSLAQQCLEIYERTGDNQE